MTLYRGGKRWGGVEGIDIWVTVHSSLVLAQYQLCLVLVVLCGIT